MDFKIKDTLYRVDNRGKNTTRRDNVTRETHVYRPHVIILRKIRRDLSLSPPLRSLFLSFSGSRALTTANRLSLIIASLLRIAAPPVADISTVYAINNTLPPTHRPCRGCDVLRTRVFASRAHAHTRARTSLQRRGALQSRKGGDAFRVIERFDATSFQREIYKSRKLRKKKSFVATFCSTAIENIDTAERACILYVV